MTATVVVCGVFAAGGVGCEARAGALEAPRAVRPFVQAVASGDARRVAHHVRLPLPRPHPLPPVRDAADFVARFDELLPRALRDELVRADADDWAQVGWRGTMFQNGRLWFDDAGALYASNEHSDAEHRRRLELIARDRASLHARLREFDEPVLRWQTPRFRVRVDRMPDGELRYASWRREAPLDAMPDLVLHDGAHRVEGTARNEYYTFVSGDHRYECALVRVGAHETPPRSLIVTRGDEQLLAEAAEQLYP